MPNITIANVVFNVGDSRKRGLSPIIVRFVLDPDVQGLGDSPNKRGLSPIIL